MLSSLISRGSAFVLLLGGLALLFAPDAVLPAVVPGFPPAGAWVGQLLAAAWLGVGAMNWLQRSARLGGIYGRPNVFANLTLHFVSALSLIRTLADWSASPLLWGATAVFAALALAYGALLMRGPFDPPG